MHIRRRRAFASICVAWFLGLAANQRARADVGLIIETPTGILGFLSDVGHSSVWISHGCLDSEGGVAFCENSAGIVLTSTAYWPNPGAAAIPAELFFLGSKPGSAGSSVAAWNESLSAAYPKVSPEFGRKYLGRVWRRKMRVTTFKTTAEEDRRALAEVERERRIYRYSYSHRNCAFYAEQVLKLYLGDEFHANRTFDLGVDTPRGLERSLQKRLAADPESSYRVVRFPGKLTQSWRQPPRTFCETAIFDPKYAIPLLWFQPYLYVGFGTCYGLTRVMNLAWDRHHPKTLRLDEPVIPEPNVAGERKVDPRLLMYRSLTSATSATSAWFGESGVAVSSTLEPVETPAVEPSDQ